MKKLILCSLALLALTACGNSDWMGDGEVFYKPKQLSLSKSTLSQLIVGETRKLCASFTPAETTKNEVLWSSSDEAVATVDEHGTIRATGLGTAVITVQSVDYPDITATCEVSVTVESGIRIYDVLLNQPIEDKITFVRNSTGERDYYLEVFVHDTFDDAVTISSSDKEIVAVETKMIGDRKGFRLLPGQKLGNAVLVIESVRNDDVRTEIPISVKTIQVTGVTLSLKEDGSQASQALTGNLTVGHTKAVRVVFATDDEQIKIPENTRIHLSSSNPDVATVDAEGTQDPATQMTTFQVHMVNNPANAPTGTAIITVKTDDGDYEATFTITAQCPGVEQIILDKTLSEPILAGKTLQLSYKTQPEDAYVQTVKWVSENEDIATVDASGLVTIKSDFLFDPANCTNTEITIKATSDDQSAVSATCKLRPYQYVPATGVLVTDQWGNRMRGTSSTGTKITAPENNYACIQYCAGGGGNKKSEFKDLQSWAVASPIVEGVDKVGSIAVYLTATPYPYTYPTIADPEQPFYWACYSNSRFSIAGAGYEEGNQATGWAGYSKDDGKSECFLGHTCKFWTGHTSSGADVTFIRVWRYVPGADNNSVQSKSDNLLLRFTVHTTDSKANPTFGNPSLKNSDGTAMVFNFLNSGGISLPYPDLCPTPWSGPMPQPVGYYTLNAGAPNQLMSWGDIPIPTKLTESR